MADIMNTVTNTPGYIMGNNSQVGKPTDIHKPVLRVAKIDDCAKGVRLGAVCVVVSIYHDPKRVQIMRNNDIPTILRYIEC